LSKLFGIGRTQRDKREKETFGRNGDRLMTKYHYIIIGIILGALIQEFIVELVIRRETRKKALQIRLHKKLDEFFKKKGESL
jgi:uncharacterized membrane-anchored protein YhcB (DUF1043 family)